MWLFLSLLATSAGIISSFALATLPDSRLSWLVAVISAASLFNRRTRLAGLFAMGFVYGCWRGELILDQRIDPVLAGVELQLIGTIEGLVDDRYDAPRFNLLLESSDQTPEVALPSRVRLSWYRNPVMPRSGQLWQFTVRMREPRGRSNPGVFDYETWMFRHNIGATGYIRSGKLLSDAPATVAAELDRMRDRIRASIRQSLGSRDGLGIVLALAIADRTGIDQQQWGLLTASGISHLIAISGLHIGLVAGFGYMLGRLGWRLLPLLRRVPVQIFASVPALLFAACYAALAGFSVPTTRALLMVLIVITALLLRRGIRTELMLALALLIVLLADPASVLSAGFWLSFAAVAVILASVRQTADWRRTILLAIKLQLVIGLALLPLILAFGGTASILSPVINIIAIPLFSFVVVPAVLSGTLLLVLGLDSSGLILAMAASLIEYSLALLHMLPLEAFIAQTANRPDTLWTLAFIGAASLLLPVYWPYRWLGTILFLPWILYKQPDIADDRLFVSFFDIGQGTAVLVRTGDATLLYDTGPAFGNGDAASTTIIPALEYLGVARLNDLVVSHGDRDHAGGAASIVRHFPGVKVYTGETNRLAGSSATACTAGQNWTLGRASVEVLSPTADQPPETKSNNRSCVIRITLGQAALLLTGDIEADIERQLVATGQPLDAGLVSIPHHGSKTSSTRAFIAATGARYAVATTGYGNRWNFPRKEVVSRWQQRAKVMATHEHGYLQFELFSDGRILFESQRDARQKYWKYPAVSQSGYEN